MGLHVLVLHVDIGVARYLHLKTKDITNRCMYKTLFRAWATDQNQIWGFGVQLGVLSWRSPDQLCLSEHSYACEALPFLGRARSRTQEQQPPLRTWVQSSISAWGNNYYIWEITKQSFLHIGLLLSWKITSYLKEPIIFISGLRTLQDVKLCVTMFIYAKTIAL